MSATDQELLEDYKARGTDEAFAALVNRYVDLVYSAALRQVREPALAQDVTQAVFIVLSRKGKALDSGCVIAGWLLRTTRFASLKALRTEGRRRRAEQEAFEMNLNPEDTTQIAPLIDEAVARLGEKDRDALVLRFFENKTFAQVASVTGTTEDAAKKRVTRAVERLRAMFVARQLPLAVASLATFLSSETVKAAPPELATKLAGVGGTAAASPSAWIIAKETIRAMLWTKLQFAASVATLLVLAAGTAGMALYTAEELAFNTPKRALRSLANSFSEGDGRKFVNGLCLTLNESPILAESWKPTLEHLVVAQGRLRKALVDRFGAVAVSNAVPMWHTLDDAVFMLTKADERVEGSQAKFPITALGQTFPEVPLMLKTNNQWKLPVDLRFKGGRPIAGGQNFSFSSSFQGLGLHLSLSAKAEFDPRKARNNLDSWANSLSQVATEVRAGKFASADETWEQCSKTLTNAMNSSAPD